MKEETRIEGPWEHGEKPVQRNSKTDWEEVKQNAINGNLDLIPADIFVKHYQTLKKIKVDHLKIPDNHEGCRGEWLWGPPGTGKTHYARSNWGTDLYIKP